MFIREIRGYLFFLINVPSGDTLEHRGLMQQLAARKAFKAQDGNVFYYVRFSLQNEISQNLARGG